MDIRGDRLAFSYDEFNPLTTMFSHYVEYCGAQLTPATKAVVDAGWHTASNVMYAGMFGNNSASIDVVNSYYERTTGINPGYQPVPEEPVEISNEHGAISAVIHWAAQNLIAGSQAHQNTVGQILNSSYEDMEVPQELGSSNDSLAEAIGRSLLEAGQVATVWSQLLSGNS